MKGFRTLGFNLAASVLPVLEAADFTDVLGQNGMAVYGALIAVANIVLRTMTTTAITKKF
jgi:hypothetical protein